MNRKEKTKFLSVLFVAIAACAVHIAVFLIAFSFGKWEKFFDDDFMNLLGVLSEALHQSFYLPNLVLVVIATVSYKAYRKTTRARMIAIAVSLLLATTNLFAVPFNILSVFYLAFWCVMIYSLTGTNGLPNQAL